MTLVCWLPDLCFAVCLNCAEKEWSVQNVIWDGSPWCFSFDWLHDKSSLLRHTNTTNIFSSGFHGFGSGEVRFEDLETKINHTNWDRFAWLVDALPARSWAVIIHLRLGDGKMCSLHATCFNSFEPQTGVQLRDSSLEEIKNKSKPERENRENSIYISHTPHHRGEMIAASCCRPHTALSDQNKETTVFGIYLFTHCIIGGRWLRFRVVDPTLHFQTKLKKQLSLAFICTHRIIGGRWLRFRVVDPHCTSGTINNLGSFCMTCWRTLVMSGHHPPPSCHWQDVLHTVHFDTKTLFLNNLFRGLV
jgi:hypothetical protein